MEIWRIDPLYTALGYLKMLHFASFSLWDKVFGSFPAAFADYWAGTV